MKKIPTKVNIELSDEENLIVKKHQVENNFNYKADSIKDIIKKFGENIDRQ